jgi:hypothetical protein
VAEEFDVIVVGTGVDSWRWAGVPVVIRTGKCLPVTATEVYIGFRPPPHDVFGLAYEMNGAPLNELHGAPLRLRNELELGFKQVKWIHAIEFVESFAQLGAGQGGYNEDHEFYGYRMPI